MSDSWFKVVSGPNLEQGDIILSCRINRILTFNDEADGDLVEISQEEHDVVVLTQTCDLVNSKVDEVLVALVVGYRDLVDRDSASNQLLVSKEFRKSANAATVIPYLLLQNRTVDPVLPWSLVDFHNLFSIPKDYLSSMVARSGDRLRLESPYKEHLAQGFAKYMMRVALPLTLEDFIAEKF